MAYDKTVITAKSDDHFQLLKGLLASAFNTPVNILAEGWAPNQLDTARLTGSQRRTIQGLGYTTENRTAYGC